MSRAKDIVASRIAPAWPHLLVAGQLARALKGGSVSSFKVILRPRPGKDVPTTRRDRKFKRRLERKVKLGGGLRSRRAQRRDTGDAWRRRRILEMGLASLN